MIALFVARIASALKAIHERPMQRWSVDTLALRERARLVRFMKSYGYFNDIRVRSFIPNGAQLLTQEQPIAMIR